MKLRMLSSRPTVTRTSRFDPRGAALESVAAEFSLLAQRRARAARQVDLLGRQLHAAQTSLDAVQSRMAMLACRMDGIDPGLRPQPAPAIEAPPKLARARAPYFEISCAPPATTARAAPAQPPARAEAAAPAAPYRPSRAMVPPRTTRPPSRRRSFPPE